MEDREFRDVIHGKLCDVVHVLDVVVVAVAHQSVKAAVFAGFRVAGPGRFHDKIGTIDPPDRFNDGEENLLVQSPAVEELFFGADDRAVSGNKEDVVSHRAEEVEHAGVLPAAAGAEADAYFLEVLNDLEVLGIDLVGTFFDESPVDITCN